MSNQSQEIGLLVAALIKAQSEFNPVIKKSSNPFFKSKYADLQAGIDATQPALQANGLVVMQFPVSEADANGNGIGVLSVLSHISGQFISEKFVLPLAKRDAQTGVAAVTYARRCAYLAIIGVAAEDDDGNTAAGRDTKKPTKAEYHTTEKPPVTLPPHSGSVLRVVSPSGATGNIEFSLPVKQEGDTFPDANQLAEYGEQVKALGFTLRAAGLTSDKLPASRKTVKYLLNLAGVAEPAQITNKQFDEFLAYASQNNEAMAKMIEAGYK